MTATAEHVPAVSVAFGARRHPDDQPVVLVQRHATTQTICWCVIFFFASAGASSAYLTVSKIFPLEVRAKAIAVFFAIAQCLGALGFRWNRECGGRAGNEARVVGSLTLYLDYTMPITPLREEARRIIEASPLWARRDWVLQVVDTTEKTMTIRVLADAADGPSAFDLKCEIREQLIEFVRRSIRSACATPGSRYRSRRALRTPG